MSLYAHFFHVTRKSLSAYFLTESYSVSEKFIDIDLLMKLANLYDIFEKLDILKKSLQGNEMHALQLADEIATFKISRSCGEEK